MAIFSQEENLKYSHKYTITEGLAHNGVTSVLEDKRGFMWFGTYDGLNRYDGYDFKIYKNTLDEDILTSNRVRTLSEDNFGNLWIGTDEGVTVYNYDYEKFTKLPYKEGKGISAPTIRKIVIHSTHGIAVCATESNEILVYDTQLNFKGSYVPNEGSGATKSLFFDGIQLNSDNLLFASTTGLWHFNIKSKQFTPILQNDIDSANKLLLLSDNRILVSLSYGVAIIEPHSDSTIGGFSLRKKILTNYRFNSMLVDSNDILWLGELNEGICKIDMNVLKTKGIDYKPFFFKDNLKRLRSSGFLQTTNTTVWYTTFNEGVYNFDISNSPFYSYNTSMAYPYGIKSNNVSHISPLDANRVFMEAIFGGTALFNLKTKQFEPLPFKLPRENALVGASFVDSRKNIWIYITGDKSVYVLKKGKTVLENISLDKVLKDNILNIRSINEDNHGNIWIGSASDVIRLTMDKDNTVKAIESLNSHTYFKNSKINLIRRIYSDPLYDYLWVGTDAKGLFRFEQINAALNDIKITQYINNKNDKHALSSNFVSAIVRLPNEDMWVGTEGGGICKVINSNTNPKFIPFTEKNGLSNNVVKNILYDNDYNLWIPTNIGLNKFDIKTNEFRKFNEFDGLPFEDFWFAGKNMANGMIILSGLDGFCYFNPSDIKTEEKIPNFLLDNFKIFNKVISPGDTVNGRVILPKSLNLLDKIVLRHDENVFSLDLTSLHFSNEKNHLIKYRLDPINKEWISVPSSQKTIYFNGLQSGDYVLNVMVSNALNEWGTPKILPIQIQPSIWNTTWAYILYALVAVLFIYLVFRVFLKIQSLNHKVVIEQMAMDNAKEINEAKLRFFSNISHEIKTPLTLISSPINMLLDRFKNNPDVGEKLRLMQRQSKKIHQLIEQVHDFRRTDVNALKMHYDRFNFNLFMEDLIQDYKDFALTDNKNLDLVGEKQIVVVSADKDKLEKIFNNLLSNAFKYTKTNDSITITYHVEEKDVIVRVSDTGKGIDSIDLEHIFERFYQSHLTDNTHIRGSGIGLSFAKVLVEMHYGFISAESEINKGSTITVRLPIVKELLEEEIKNDIKLPSEKEIIIDNHFFNNTAITNIKASGEFSDALVFYAEDNPEMRRFVSDMLTKFFRVRSFRNGQECFDALEDEWPEIIISDVQMPEMNGLDLCIKVKSDLKTSHIPVILLTALANIEDHIQGIRDGADAYIKKPFNGQQLITRIEALLTNRKQLRERYKIGLPLTKENNRNNKNDNAFLEKLYSLIEQNLDNQDFDLNSLAKELYLNRTHFYQKVKSLTDQTPFELLKNYRLKKAANFLVQDKLTVNEAYILTGFKSRSHFSKIFKDKYGISASKYASEVNDKYSMD